MKYYYYLILFFLTTNALLYSQPTIEWVGKYGGNTFNHFTKDMVIDDEGNVYMTGALVIDSGNCDFVTLKYNNSGNLLWARTYDGPQSGEDIPVSIKLDGSGNVIVAGTSRNTTGFPIKIFSTTIKYNSDGDSLWVRRYLNQDSLFYLIKGMVVDSVGGVYIIGEIDNFAQNINILLTKYSPEGNIEWQNELDIINEYDTPKIITLDKSNNIATYNSTGIGGMLIKYNHLGDSLWGITITPQAIDYMVFDEFNNVYLGGVGHEMQIFFL
jgi:hypothetical protein